MGTISPLDEFIDHMDVVLEYLGVDEMRVGVYWGFMGHWCGGKKMEV